MNARYRLISRGGRRGTFYCVAAATGRRTSLHTTDEDEAQQLVQAKNNAQRRPLLNLQIAKAYAAGTDNGINTRTWRNAIEALIDTKQGANAELWAKVEN